MTLYEKIRSLYPDLSEDSFAEDIIMNDVTGSPFSIPDGAVRVGNVYIEKWGHPTLAKPTQAQLDAITE